MSQKALGLTAVAELKYVYIIKIAAASKLQVDALTLTCFEIYNLQNRRPKDSKDGRKFATQQVG